MTPSDSRSPSTIRIELCAGGIDDVGLAAQCGIPQIELNSGMPMGGLTPPAGLVGAARREFSGSIIAMVRPREGGFQYSRAEFHQMLDDCEFLFSRGMDGVAIGFLQADGTVDEARCRKLRSIFPQKTLVFHKAFDVTPNLPLALQKLIDCGFQRVLTSGGKLTALEGADVLRGLNHLANGAIEILAAGGIRAANVIELLQRSECRQIHSAVRTTHDDPSTRRNAVLHFGVSGSSGNGCFGAASAQQLTELQAAVASF